MFDSSYYEKEYSYFKDDRTENEQQLTTQLANILSEININRIKQTKLLQDQQINRQLRKEDFLYVCINGMPPFKDEFKELDLPGQILEFCNRLSRPNLTNEQIMNSPTQWDEQANILNETINNCSKTKPLVFVFHSFGTYIASSYFHLFPHDRIIGLIDIGGAPIRFNPYLQQFIRMLQPIQWKHIQDNIDAIDSNYREVNKKRGIAPYPTKYHFLASIRSAKEGIGFKKMFILNRSWPKVLKCFIYGRKDSIFPAHLLNQKAIFYCYKNRIIPDTENHLSLAFTKITGQKCVNIQERYIFNVEQGYHSIHMQKRCKNLIKQIVKEYLSVIEMQNITTPKM